MDVGEWLRGLSLGEYEEKFRDHKIDGKVLASLTADDLRDIGVSAVGDRRRLLDAISLLAGARPLTDRPASELHSAPDKGRQISAERRPITVMFCDLVGSTGLAASLDAEDWHNLVSAYLDEAQAAVAGLGGHVLKKLGDGLMALFGYPQAQENDAERAVRAALAIQRALANLNARNASKGSPELAARIGLNSGPVVVDAAGEVFGDAPNVAARVQATAESGAVLVTANVQRQIAGLFVAEDRGAHELKGAPTPVTLYRIVRASGGGRRFGARALTPLVGREEELDLLRRRWERAVRGEGQLALVVGEPGIGKSRLVEEFRLRLGEAPHTFVEWSSSQLLQNTPLHPIAEWGRQRFGADLPSEKRLADLENTLRLIGLDPTDVRISARTAGGNPAARGARGEARAGGTAPPAVGGAHGVGSRRGAVAAGRPRGRGPALGRPDLARSDAGSRRARRAGTALHHRDRAAGIPPALELALPSHRHLAEPPRSRRRRTDGRRARRSPCAKQGGGRGGE